MRQACYRWFQNFCVHQGLSTEENSSVWHSSIKGGAHMLLLLGCWSNPMGMDEERLLYTDLQ